MLLYCEASVCHLCISSVGCSVRSYVCTDLQSIRKVRQPFKRAGSMEPMEPPLDPPLLCGSNNQFVVVVTYNCMYTWYKMSTWAVGISQTATVEPHLTDTPQQQDTHDITDNSESPDRFSTNFNIMKKTE